MSKRKPYNPRKSFKLQAQQAMFVSFDSEREGEDKVCVTNIASASLRDAVISMVGDWVVQMGVIYKLREGYESKEATLIARGIRLNDLTDHYQAEKAKLLNNANPNITADFGWVIRPLSKRLERKIDADSENGVLNIWLQRRAQFEKKTLQSLAMSV